jgi:hypothetical protein
MSEAGDDVEMADLLRGAWCGFKGQPTSAPTAAPTVTEDPAPPEPVEPEPVEPMVVEPSGSTSQPGNRQVIQDGNSIVANSTGTGPSSSSASVKTDTSGSRYGNQNEITIMGTDASYLQCKAARTLGMVHPSIDGNLGLGAGQVRTIQQERVGSLAVSNDTLLNKTFRGSRISTGEKIVNQNVSLSFDPLTLICTCCSKPHNIVPTDGSGLVIVVSDQNFVSGVVGKDFCIPVIRIEDGTLLELADFTQEILNRTPIPAGTLFLVGTVSHLVQVGSTIYALDWQKTVNRYTDRWPNCKVGPLPPILRDDCPGITGRHLVEIKHWFDKTYARTESIVFAHAAWDCVIKGLGSATYQSQDLDHTELYTVPLPLSLKDRTLYPQKVFLSSSTAITPGLDGDATHELLLALLHTLCSHFGCRANPEDMCLARAPAESEGIKDTPTTPTTLIIIGASHMSRLVPHLAGAGYDIVDLTHPGWSLTDTNIGKIVDEIGKIEKIGTAVCIMDLVSNTSFRFENKEDGSLSLPFKIGGHYHMDGRVTTSTLETLHNLMNKATPIMDALPGLKICTPPIPRYLKTPCCDVEGHCDGISEPDHAIDLMSKTLAIRRQLKEYSVEKGMPTIWVPDMLRMMFPTATTTATLTEQILSVTHADGVHLLDDGYAMLGTVLLDVVKTRLAYNVHVSGDQESGSSKSYYWRGFTSPTGSARPKPSVTSYKDSHPGGGKWKTPSPRHYASYPSARGRGKSFTGATGGRRWN